MKWSTPQIRTVLKEFQRAAEPCIVVHENNLGVRLTRGYVLGVNTGIRVDLGGNGSPERHIPWDDIVCIAAVGR